MDEMNKLKVMVVCDMRFNKITMPVLNHQMNIANPKATKVSIILSSL
jgi:hypothetical protein